MIFTCCGRRANALEMRALDVARSASLGHEFEFLELGSNSLVRQVPRRGKLIVFAEFPHGRYPSRHSRLLRPDDADRGFHIDDRLLGADCIIAVKTSTHGNFFESVQYSLKNGVIMMVQRERAAQAAAL